MRKILFLLTSLLVMSLTVSAWGYDASFTIGTDFDTITEALESADESGFADVEIILQSSYTLESAIQTSLYSGVSSITITGGGNTFTSASGQRHFIIDSETSVTFENISSFRGGSGGIEISSGTLTISGGSTFTGNSASNGGALYITGGTVTVNDDNTFANNTATSNGGAVYVSGGTVSFTGSNTFGGTNTALNGGALYVDGGNVTFSSNNTFTTNTATSDGGAIYVNSGTVTFEGSDKFTGNTAANGGAIYIASSGSLTLASPIFNQTNNASSSGGAVYSAGTLNFTGSAEFASNTAASDGGALYISGGTVTFSDAATFSNNESGSNGGAVCSAGTVNFTGTATFTSNTATSNGGALYISEGTVTLSNTASFTGNTASAGGAVYNAGTANFTGKATFSGTNEASDGGALYNSGTMTFSDSPSFESNNATNNGGAVYLEGGTLTFSAAASFTTNHSTVDGGAIYVSSGTLEAGNITLTFKGNYSESYSDTSNTESNPAEGSGGALCIAGGTVNLGTLAVNSHKATYGGALYISGGTLSVTGTASFGTDTANEAYDGGALYIAGGTTTFSGETTFTGNTAKNDGGALFIERGTLKFSSAVTFNENQANTDTGSLGNGGAVYWGVSANNFASTFASASSVSFTNNSVLSSYSENDTVDYTAALGNGGAIYCTGSGTLTLNADINYTFSGNTASANGGAIFTTIAKLLIENVDITAQNTATYGGGGFAASSSGDITVNYSSFSKQDAKMGGALYAESMKITSSDFTENTSGTGGGGAIASFYKLSTGEIAITESTFTKNETDGRGGAVLARTANFNVTNTFFGTNIADDNGGAIDIGGESTTTIQQSTFANNASKNSGGAIYADGEFRIQGSTKKTVSKNLGRCYFVSNNAQKFGGAIHYDQRDKAGEFILQGSLFEDNVATEGSGGAVNVASDVAKIDSCTFDNNTSGADTNAVSGYGGGAVFMFISGANVNEGRDSGIIRNCVFARNKVEGGGDYNCGGAVSILGTVKVISCTISLGNTAANYGGAVFVGNNATLIISGTIAVGNTARNGNDIYKGDGANIETGGYNRVGIYGTGGNNTGWTTDVGVESDREGATWSKADFFSDNDLAANIRSTSIPPTVGSSVGTVDAKRLPSLMLKEAESLPLADRATTVIPYTLRYNFPQYDIRGVDRWELRMPIDIGAVFFDGTRSSTDDDENSHYSISSIRMSGVPNSMKAIGQTASLLAVIRYTNGRSAYAGNLSGQEKVTWASLPQGNNIIKITSDGVITAIGEGTAYITVTTNRAKEDGTYATDRQAVKVNQSAILNLAPEFYTDFNNFLKDLYEYDMSAHVADPNTSVIASSAFKTAFKSKWNADPSAILDMSEVYPDFSIKSASEYKANTTLYLAAAQAQRPGISISLPECTTGDLLAVNYSWNLKDIKSLLGDDYELDSADAQLASDLFTKISINFTTASNNNINVVNADNAKALFNSKALVLSKSDSNNGVHIELTAYLAHADYSGSSSAPQLVNNLLIVPDDSASDSDTISGTMWLAQGTSSNNNNTNNNNSNGSGSGGGSGGGGCNSLALGIIAASLVFALKRR